MPVDIYAKFPNDNNTRPKTRGVVVLSHAPEYLPVPANNPQLVLKLVIVPFIEITWPATGEYKLYCGFVSHELIALVPEAYARNIPVGIPIRELVPEYARTMFILAPLNVTVIPFAARFGSAVIDVAVVLEENAAVPEPT